MRRRPLLTLLLAFFCACACHRRPQPVFHLPTLMLWAWQRPEDLTFLPTANTGIAYLAGTVRIQKNGFPSFQPRLMPLKLPTNAAFLSVVRIESKPPHAPVNTAVLAQILTNLASVPGARGLQIDFDATSSDRLLYRSLLNTLIAQSALPIGITALASWCAGDRWLDRIPLAEAVPMFFQMGKKENPEMPINSPICRCSIGLSTDEPWPSRRPTGLQRIYLFSPHAWTPDIYTRAVSRLKSWH